MYTVYETVFGVLNAQRIVAGNPYIVLNHDLEPSFTKYKLLVSVFIYYLFLVQMHRRKHEMYAVFQTKSKIIYLHKHKQSKDTFTKDDTVELQQKDEKNEILQPLNRVACDEI